MMEQVIAQDKIDASVRELTVSLMMGVANNDLRTQVARVADFVRKNVTYVRDPEDSEYLIAPTKMISDYHSQGVMFGDCDDHVMLLNAMVGSIGIPSKAVGVKFGGSPTFNHVISGVICCGSMQLIDPCAKNGPQQVYTETLTV
jgi:transglutaminase-like putative cysteine protease